MTLLRPLTLAFAAVVSLTLPARAELDIKSVTSPGGITEMMRGCGRRHPRAARDLAQRKTVRPALDEQHLRGSDEGGAQVAMVVRTRCDGGTGHAGRS